VDVVSDRARDDVSRLIAGAPEVPARDSLPAPAADTIGVAHEVLPFREVYDRYFAFVWRSAANRGVRQAALDDVVQEVFIVVHRKLPEFQGRSSLRTWIASVVRWVVTDYTRKRGNQPAGDQLPEHTASSGAMPLEELERKAAVQLLDALLSKMSEEQREVFVLHELEHMSGIEIAEITGTNENTVWSRLRAARKIFQEGVAREKARGSREQA
jgi:RNA polymerase sigma-70 factor (ECF subfamily)